MSRFFEIAAPGAAVCGMGGLLDSRCSRLRLLSLTTRLDFSPSPAMHCGERLASAARPVRVPRYQLLDLDHEHAGPSPFYVEPSLRSFTNIYER